MAMRFFLGANSREGFVSLYPQLQREAPRRLYLVKSGPGCGKATCIRALSKALGGPEEYIHCSSDPDSLDGVILADRAILDGTAPHDKVSLGHSAKKVRFCEGLRGRKYEGTNACDGL